MGDGTASNSGSFHVFLGPLIFGTVGNNGNENNCNYSNYGERSSDGFAFWGSLDSGDFNKNGYSDIIVGASWYEINSTFSYQGQASVWEIPEFHDIFIPIVGSALMFIFIRRRRIKEFEEKEE
jgi:hypothetical protein